MLQLHHKAGHRTCILRESQTSTQAFFKFIITRTSIALILSPPYLKTIIKHQTYLSIQRTQKKVSQILNTKYINIKQITMLLTTLKIIKVKHERSIVSLKQIHHRALKDLSEAHREKL